MPPVPPCSPPVPCCPQPGLRSRWAHVQPQRESGRNRGLGHGLQPARGTRLQMAWAGCLEAEKQEIATVCDENATICVCQACKNVKGPQRKWVPRARSMNPSRMPRGHSGWGSELPRGVRRNGPPWDETHQGRDRLAPVQLHLLTVYRASREDGVLSRSSAGQHFKSLPKENHLFLRTRKHQESMSGNCTVL